MMPDFAGVEKVFAHMTFKASGAAGLFLSEAILHARNPKRKPRSRAAGHGGSRGHTENDLAATTGDIQWKPDSRAT